MYNTNMRVLRSSYIKNYGWLTIVVAGLLLSLTLYLLGRVGLSEALLTGLCLVGVVPEIVSIVKDFLNRRFGVDIIAVVAILASLGLGEYATAGIILLMFTGGVALEKYAKARAQKELSSLLKRAPKIAHVLRGKEFLNVAVSKVQPKDIVLIKPGETVPVDGVVVSGESSFDESAITGESMPQNKKKNSQVLSGTINQDAPVQVRAIHTSEASQYEQIINLVRSAASNKSPMVRLADTYSIPFTIISFGLAGLAWAISGDPVRALAVLVVATPCPLLIATPVAIVSGMNRAARDGIIIKDGASLEKLAVLQALAFDKTGTLTKNQPTISKIVAIKTSQSQLLSLAASVEQESTHVLAGVIVSSAKRQRLKLHKPSSLHEEVGGGVRAVVGGKDIFVGKLEFLLRNKIKIPHGLAKSTATAVYIGQGDTFMGFIEFADPIRANTKYTLLRLKKLGIEKTMILTGDKPTVARAIAQQAGISEIHAGLLPVDKLHLVKTNSSTGQVTGMVGDGVNDAPVLAAADVGIALGAKGSTAASESADVVVMLDDISRVADAVTIAQNTVTIAKQSIFIGIGLSLLLMILASLGKIEPFYGAILQEIIDVVVIFNALRAHLGKQDS